MHTVIYNCKSCKRGKRVDYPLGNARTGFSRIDSTGKAVPAAVWIQSCGGGKPTVYGGDTEMGICACGKMMTFGALKAFLNPDRLHGKYALTNLRHLPGRIQPARGDHHQCVTSFSTFATSHP